MSGLSNTLYILDWIGLIFVFLAGYAVLIKLIFSLIRLSNHVETLQNNPHERQMDSESMMPVTLLLADCDTDKDPAATVRRLMDLEFPEYEVVAVCDSQAGPGLKKLVDAFDMVVMHQPIKKSVPMHEVRDVYRSPLWPGLIVLDKQDGGRHDALNACVNVSRYPLVLSLAAGSHITADALTEVAVPFMRSFSVVAVGGLPRVDSNATGVLSSYQQVEYLRDFPAGIVVPGQKKLPLIPGAFGAFRKSTLIAEGGFAPGTGETEMVVQLYRKRAKEKDKYDIEVLAAPVYQTDPPKGLGRLFAQRRVWQKSVMSSLRRNMGMFLNPTYGRGGMLDIPGHVLSDIIGPILELIACIVFPISFAMGIISFNMFLAFLVCEVLFGIINSLAACISQQIVSSDRPSAAMLFRMILFSILGNIGYRQLILIYRVVAMVMPRPKSMR